jgi:hypothetical protein
MGHYRLQTGRSPITADVLVLDVSTNALAIIGYQNLPFQFSCHVEQADGSFSHASFLSLDGSDPRRARAKALLACCDRPNSGAGDRL